MKEEMQEEEKQFEGNRRCILLGYMLAIWRLE